MTSSCSLMFCFEQRAHVIPLQRRKTKSESWRKTPSIGLKVRNDIDGWSLDNWNKQSLSFYHVFCQHDDVIKWKLFQRYWSFRREIHRSPVDSLPKASDAELWRFLWICAWTNGWANTRDAGDLRRNRAYYDVTVMITRLHNAAAM